MSSNLENACIPADLSKRQQLPASVAASSVALRVEHPVAKKPGRPSRKAKRTVEAAISEAGTEDSKHAPGSMDVEAESKVTERETFDLDGVRDSEDEVEEEEKDESKENREEASESKEDKEEASESKEDKEECESEEDEQEASESDNNHYIALPQRQVASVRPPKGKQPAVPLRNRQHSPEPKPEPEPDYDPSTCFFSVNALALLKDSTKSPFVFHSTTVYEGLRDKVAEKLDCYSIKLHYCLENDKQKEGSTSIQSEEDFTYFMNRMQSLSSFRVIFENANKAADQPTDNNGKKSSKWALSTPPHLDMSNEPTDKLQINVIAQLLEQYHCEKHSTGTVTHYCYCLSGTICYRLTMSDITFWALDMLSKETDTTILEKPKTLFLSVAQDTKHAKSPPSMLPYMMNPVLCMMPAAHYPSNYPPPQGYPSHGYPNHPDQLHPPVHPPSLHSNAPASFPEITPWLNSLNEHVHCSSPHIDFSSLSESLSRNGFFHINQLASEFVSVDKLMDLLQTNYGTVVQLLQYAKEDTETCRMGKP